MFESHLNIRSVYNVLNYCVTVHENCLIMICIYLHHLRLQIINLTHCNNKLQLLFLAVSSRYSAKCGKKI